jgi:hypothetical protein
MCSRVGGDLDDILSDVGGLVHGHVVFDPLGPDAREELRVCCPGACMPESQRLAGLVTCRYSKEGRGS